MIQDAGKTFYLNNAILEDTININSHNINSTQILKRIIID